MKIVVFFTFLIFCANLIAQENLFSGHKMILDEGETLYYNTPLLNNRDILVQRKKTNDNVLTKITLAPDNTSRNNIIKEMWSNFEIYKNFNFNLIVSNSHLGVPKSSSLYDFSKKGQRYFFECRDKNTGVLEGGKSLFTR